MEIGLKIYNELMKLLILFFLSSNVFAADCLKEYFNYASGLKFKGSFTDLYETQKEIHQGNPDLNVICKDKSKNEMWESDRKSIAEGEAQKQDELTKSHKISTGELDLLKTDEAVYIGSSDICARMDKAIKEKEDCYETAEFATKLRKTDILSMTFEEACKKLGPDIIRRIRVCKYKN